MKEILKRFDIENANITSFVSAEDGSPYSVWRLEVCGKMYVLKKAKNYELEVYSPSLRTVIRARLDFLTLLLQTERIIFSWNMRRAQIFAPATEIRSKKHLMR